MASTGTLTNLDQLRVDQVGSFLPSLKRWRDAFGNELDAGALLSPPVCAPRKTRRFATSLPAEEQHGLLIVCDGEFRCRSFMQSFEVVAGMEPWWDKRWAAPPWERPSDPNEPLCELGNEVRTTGHPCWKLTLYDKFSARRVHHRELREA